MSRKDIRSKYFSVFHKFLQPKFEDAVIAQIEAAGLIQQEPDPEDRRKLLLLPSPKNDAEKMKYIPHDSGYSSENTIFPTKTIMIQIIYRQNLKTKNIFLRKDSM